MPKRTAANRGEASFRDLMDQEEVVIQACIKYCALEAATNAAFKADPDPNHNRVENIAYYNGRSQEKALIAALPAVHTIAGVNATAKVLTVLANSMNHLAPGETETAFIAAAAEDVSRLMGKWMQLAEEHKQSAKAA